MTRTIYEKAIEFGHPQRGVRASSFGPSVHHAMNAYYFGENDQPRSSWVMYELAKPVEGKTRKSKLPNAILRFFGPQPDGEMRMKPQYLSALCSSCGRYTMESVFRIGFSDPVCIRIKGGFSHTQDRVSAVSARFLQALKTGM